METARLSPTSAARTAPRRIFSGATSSSTGPTTTSAIGSHWNGPTAGTLGQAGYDDRTAYPDGPKPRCLRPARYSRKYASPDTLRDTRPSRRLSAPLTATTVFRNKRWTLAAAPAPSVGLSVDIPTLRIEAGPGEPRRVEPPSVQTGPDGVYLPTHFEGMDVVGTTRRLHLRTRVHVPTPRWYRRPRRTVCRRYGRSARADAAVLLVERESPGLSPGPDDDSLG